MNETLGQYNVSMPSVVANEQIPLFYVDVADVRGWLGYYTMLGTVDAIYHT